jgi:energy-coupling factor transporter ATP-binding protein EcfA2
MSILQEILTWSQSLPAWQSDAIARLFAKQELSQTDLDHLYALLKAEHGIPDPKGRVAKRLQANQIPSAPSTTSHTDLLAVKNLKFVNAIAENQRLPFGPTGLTVIYGDNGSGKSGYSRVLKRACRARDQSELIHPKATLPAGKPGTAQATFEISVNGNLKTVLWEDGKDAPKELSTLAIFDSRCARAYLDVEDDFAYVPYGLDIIKGLAQTCNQLEAMARTELAQNEPDTTSIDDLSRGTTAVANLLAGLSAKTRPEKVEALAKLSAKDIDRRNELEQSLKTDNPTAKAGQVRLLSARIAKIAKSVTEKSEIVAEEVVVKLRGLVEARKAALEAAKLAAQIFEENDKLLPGTGGEAWKRLFEAARSFYREACPSEDFSHLDPKLQCPLCQQPLGQSAVRMEQFEKFVQAETEKNVRVREEEFSDEYRRFGGQTVELGFDQELQTEIDSAVPGLGAATKAYGESLTIRRDAIKQVCDSQAWSDIVSLPASPAADLQSLSEKLTEEAASLEKAADVVARNSMEEEFRELDARLKLSKFKAAVITAITKHSLCLNLNKCLRALKTNAISKKATELAASVISKDLEAALNSEFKALSAESLRVSLQSRSAKGKTLHKLKLGSAQGKNPADVLSEGEQRAIAIGSFLAEVNLGGGTGGVVFDDPVSSLDHKRRERVAKRLVEEALKRQMIIFTHDVYFVSLLVDEAARVGAICVTQSLTRKPEGYGVADPRLPFEVMGTKARLGELRQLQQGIEKLFNKGDELEHRKQTIDAYRQLRLAWERAVEEILLRKVVIRFGKGISTQPLIEVVVEDSDYTTIDNQMTKCSNYAHDQALLGGTAIPDPDELLADINTLDTWRSMVDKRSDVVRKRRKAGAPKAS